MSEQNIEDDFNSSLEAPVDDRLIVTGDNSDIRIDRFSLLRYNRSALVIVGGILGLILLVATVSALLTGTTQSPDTADKPGGLSAYDIGSLPLSNRSELPLALGQAEQLTINGRLRVEDGLVLAATTAPLDAVVGQFYFDQTSRQPYFYDGNVFVPFVQTFLQGVSSLGGANGAIALGNGLNLAAGTLSNSGVLAVNGTADQVKAAIANGVVTLTLPQAIATTSSPTFNKMTLDGTASVAGNTTLSGGASVSGIVTINTTGTGATSIGNTGLRSRCREMPAPY